jgi:hypothetical protein
MTHTLIPFAVIWVALALIVIGLAAYRRVVAAHEDDSLHVREDEIQIVAQQGAIAHKLEVIDKWGKILTVVAAAYGVVLGGLYLYWSWIEMNATSTNLQILR